MDGEQLVDLQKYLQDHDCIDLLSFCAEPKSWNEIRKLKVKDSKLFKMMKELKTAKALGFTDGKYFTAPFVKEHL
jgi:hypothetical protein